MLMFYKTLLLSLFFTLATQVIISSEAKAKTPTRALPTNLDSVITTALNTFNTPGMAVGIVYQGNVIHLQGYGIRDINTQQLVDEHTLFRLASTSKAFTAMSLALLVDEGKLNWQDKVVDHLPEFKMKDHWVTGEFTIKDLLTHKSGLVSGAGDSMLWPEPSGFTRQEIIHNLRYLTPEYSFRSHYAYSNIMYIVAGELVAKISGMPWSDFVEQHIFTPLNMSCYAGKMPLKALSNIASAHGDDNGRLFTIPRNGIKGTETVSAAAGGIVCNAKSMTNWLNFLLQQATVVENKNITNTAKTSVNPSLITAQQFKQLWHSETLLPISEHAQEYDHTFFKTYALGWRKANFLGYQLISHTGTLSGYQAYVALIPSLELGVVLLNNGSNSGARAAVMQTILRAFIKNEDTTDWVQHYQEYRQQQREKYLAKHKKPIGSNKVLFADQAYAGIYQDQWFGQVNIIENAQCLRFNSIKMPQLAGCLAPFNEHTFIVRWDNKNAANDALLYFKTDITGKVSQFTMTPYTDNVSVSHEYRDMVFLRQEEEKPKD